MGKVGGAKHAANTKQGRARHAKTAPRPRYVLPAAVAGVCIAISIPVAFSLNGVIGASSQTLEAGSLATTQSSISSAQAQIASADSSENGTDDVQRVLASSSDEGGDLAPSGENASTPADGAVAASQQAEAADAQSVGSENVTPESQGDAAQAEASAQEPGGEGADARADAGDSPSAEAADDANSQAGAANEQPSEADEAGKAADDADAQKPETESALVTMSEKLASVKASTYEADTRFFESVIENGAPTAPDVAYHLASHPISYVSYVANVTETLQEGVLDAGCEIVSLSVAMRSMGVGVDPIVIADNYIDMNGSFADGFMGDPRSGGGCFPAGIVRAANDYLSNARSSLRAYDLTGNSLDTLAGLVERGYPVLVWTTTDFEDPYMSGFSEGGYEWYGNEHCVLMYGVEGDEVLLNDSLEGLVRRDRARFAEIYEKCGSMAVYLH